ncbi:MAG TPA: hypothetical protein VKA21_15550 [Candidatus Binatia bacterium]|nr:hypothetical protein [Candidatus Binatia bacterium]
MRILGLGAAIVGVALGCAGMGVPHAPIATTPTARRCVRQCRSLHDRCVTKAHGGTDDDFWSFANPRVDVCNDRLGQCYATCGG